MSRISQLFSGAKDLGLLSQGSHETLKARDVGAQIQQALGVSADQITGSEVFLLTMFIDDSASIRFAGNTEHVRTGHNLVLEEMRRSKSVGDILAHTRFLNGTLLYPFVPLAQAVNLDTHNYNPDGRTPLFDQTVIVLGTVLAKEAEFAAQGVPVRSATLIVTDGNDEHSRNHTAKDCRELVEDMLVRENHIVAGMGLDDGKTVFRAVFGEMGIPKDWILTPGSSGSEIRKAFGVFSRTSSIASQGAAGFSKATGGGFGAA